MMRRFVALALVAFSLAGCGDRFPDYHYKMTIYVDGQPFSSVRAVEQEEVLSIADSSGRTVKRSLRGEAVIIDHPNGRTYYALIGKPGSPQYGAFAAELALMPLVRRAQRSESDNWMGQNQSGDLDLRARDHQAMVAIEGPQELRRRVPVDQLRRHSGSGDPDFPAWPMFVTFTNPANPRTVREVSPESIGVERITIEITDEDVTEGIEERLGWLVGRGGRKLDGQRFNNSQALANQLSAGSFTTGVSQ